MRRKVVSLLAGTTLALAVAVPAWADSILFNPAGTGLGGASPISGLDPGPGNTLSTLNPTSPVGTTGTAFFQANQSTGFLPTNCVSQCFTYVASFQESLSAPLAGATLQFIGPAPTGTQGTFIMYATVAAGPGNDLAGTGFVTGTPILQGTFINSSITGAFTVNGNPVTALDHFNANNYATNTVQGSGGFRADIQVTSSNLGYFPNLTPGSILTLNATSESTLPFSQVDPSACFSNTASNVNPGAGCAGGTVGVGSVGAVNGGTPGANTMFQSDANISFTFVPSPVPEPATLSLLGLGLVAGAARLRKRIAKK